MRLNDAAGRLFDPVDVGLHEGVAQPGDAEDTDTGAHAGLEGAGVQHHVGVDAAQQGGQRGDAQHDDQDGVGGVHQRLGHQAQARAVDDGVGDHAQHAQQEQQHRGFGARFDRQRVVAAQGDQAFFQAFQVHRIVRQLGVEQPGHQQRHHQHGAEGGWDHHHQQVQVADTVAFHHRRHVHHRGGDRRGGDGDLGGDDGGRQRAARLDALLFRHLGDHRQCRERDVAGAGEDGQEVSDDRGENGDVFGVLAQQFFGLLHQVVHPPGDLHRGDRRDHRHDDGNHVEGNAAWLDADQRQDQNAQPPREPDTDTAQPGP